MNPLTSITRNYPNPRDGWMGQLSHQGFIDGLMTYERAEGHFHKISEIEQFGCVRGGVELNEFRIDFYRIFRIIFHLSIES